jgi:hypothetical protein
VPFTSKRQWRAAFSGRIPGIKIEDAREWARESPPYDELPDRAPGEKGKPTLRTKKAMGFEPLIELLGALFKEAALGTAVVSPRNVGRLRGMMTTHAMKTPGYSPMRTAAIPGRGLVTAMNVVRPS